MSSEKSKKLPPVTFFLELPLGSLGVGIQKAEDGTYVVSSTTNSKSPLKLQDVIVSLNGLRLSSVEGGVDAVVKTFEASATEIRNVVVLRSIPTASTGDHAVRPAVSTTDAHDVGRNEESVNHLRTNNPRGPADVDNAPSQVVPTKATDAANKSKLTIKVHTAESFVAVATDMGSANNAEIVADDHSMMADTPLPGDISDTKEGHVAPLDIVRERNRYPKLFREYTYLSDREKGGLQYSSDPIVPDGYCTKIMGTDFAQTLPPFEGEGVNVPFKHDSIINKFYIFMWNLLDACESGSIGGDACRMNDVLIAATDDLSCISPNQGQIEHLLGLTMAITRHGLWAFLDRGNPDSGLRIFAEMAKEWKKFFELDYDTSWYIISQDVRGFAKEYCEGLQQMLKDVRKTHAAHATKYNFNYIRIPRPSRSKHAQKEKANQSSANSGVKRKTADEGSTAKKKKKKPSEATKLIERIISVEGVPGDRVYDTCPELRTKIRTFLERKGMTKSMICVALGGINHNSLNRFLSAAGQNQSGNATYRAEYIFLEKLRILEGKPKSIERLQNEEQMPSGYDFSKPKGGRPEMYFYSPKIAAMMESFSYY